jgi:hypothetical protein
MGPCFCDDYRPTRVRNQPWPRYDIAFNSAHASSGHFLNFNGSAIFWRSGGLSNTSAPTLLCIHGFPTSSYDWSAVWRALGQHYHLLAFDMLGFGLSDKPRSHAYSIIEQADIAERLLDSQGVADSLYSRARFGLERCAGAAGEGRDQRGKAPQRSAA